VVGFEQDLRSLYHPGWGNPGGGYFFKVLSFFITQLNNIFLVHGSFSPMWVVCLGSKIRASNHF
jgi:hypothetical protein